MYHVVNILLYYYCLFGGVLFPFCLFKFMSPPLQSYPGELQKDSVIQDIAKLGACVLEGNLQLFPNLPWLCYFMKVEVLGRKCSG